jgi:hypothetical protein
VALKTKTVYKWTDPRSGIEVRSKEEWKSGKKVIHFPFNTRTGLPKYRQIERITYEDLPRSLPSGYLKTASRGYGFTRDLSPVLYSLQDALPNLRRLIVSGTRSTQVINKREIVLSNADLQIVRPRLAALQTGQRAEVATLANNELARLFPKIFSPRPPRTRVGS